VARGQMVGVVRWLLCVALVCAGCGLGGTEANGGLQGGTGQTGQPGRPGQPGQAGQPTARPGTAAPGQTPGAAGAAATATRAPNAPAATNAPASNANNANNARNQRGAVLSKEVRGSATIPQIDDLENVFLLIDHDVPSKYAVDWFKIEFSGTDLQDKPLRLTAQLFVPKNPNAPNMPIYVFGPGTTGLVDECAPSKEEPSQRNWGDFQSHMFSYATQGYVAVMPDFEGFNDGPRIHHYYVGELQARVMLDAARAAQRFFDEGAGSNQSGPGKPKDNGVFFAGYSHGGYVALAARDFAKRYAPELNVKGAIGYGPRSDPTTLFKEMPSLGPYLLWSYADLYGKDKVPFERIMLPKWVGTLEHDVLSMCIDEIPTYYGADPRQVFTQEFLGAIDDGSLGAKFPALKQLLDRNKAGLGAPEVPVLVLQGTDDTVVYPATLRAYMREVCGTGAHGTYVPYVGIQHILTRQVSYEDAVNWMNAIMAGKPPKSTC
jgi:pimeloyl-ACP methyl ester carboxylesterase